MRKQLQFLNERWFIVSIDIFFQIFRKWMKKKNQDPENTHTETRPNTMWKTYKTLDMC